MFHEASGPLKKIPPTDNFSRCSGVFKRSKMYMKCCEIKKKRVDVKPLLYLPLKFYDVAFDVSQLKHKTSASFSSNTPHWSVWLTGTDTFPSCTRYVKFFVFCFFVFLEIKVTHTNKTLGVI